MNIRRPYIIVICVLAVFIFVGAGANCSASEFTQEFSHDADRDDQKALSALVNEYKATISGEVKMFIEAARSIKSQNERDAAFNMAELMAKIYMDATGDSTLLIE